ncbi:MAG TPA: acyl-CoA dehydrogenase family protein [Candidatus Acidoferrales bacterium]|nr:acyl-CoA dehydrogenase family protein [Candidatus Acidoferrales bacterium]
MEFDSLRSPLAFLERALDPLPRRAELAADAAWWEAEGKVISYAVDRAGTPWLRMFDRFGARTEEILYPPEYRVMLLRGYRAGAVWRPFEENSLRPAYELIYHTSFYDPGVCCPYTVSLATAVSLAKYGGAELQARFLAPLLRKDYTVWQGATWMTEIKGGSDLGEAVETAAKPAAGRWRLDGEKYFASNAGAELAVVAARPEGAPGGVKGLALFLLPRIGEGGQLNYLIRRLKDKIATRSVPTGEVELQASEAYLLGAAESGIYLILEILNLSRVANSVVAAALTQRAMLEALEYAERRTAFGRRILEHPLLARQFEDRFCALREAFALAWEAAELLNEVWREQPPYSDRYHLFRLLAHLAKYWTAEVAVQTAKWNMEVHGGLGVLGEYNAERWLRETMILGIWEGTPHRQVLDGLEVMARKRAHRLLFEHLAEQASGEELRAMESRVERHLGLPAEEREATAEPVFRDLAAFAARVLARKRPG